MKTFFVFAGEKYYPSRAMGDFKDSFEDYEAAKRFKYQLELDGYDWVEIEDMTNYL